MPRFFCPECIIPGSFNPDGDSMNVGFTTDAQLQAHIKKEHANCPFCDRRCASQSALEKHIDSQHSGTTLAQRKNIPCTYLGCTKTFTKKSNLTVHIRTAHNGERYVCGTFDVNAVPDLALFNTDDGCGKDFVSKANLEDHVRTAHLGMPSLINSKRKRLNPVTEDDDENLGFGLHRGRKGKRVFEQPSAFDDLTGAVYDDDERRTISCTVPGCRHRFMREYDLEVHLRTKQHLHDHDPSSNLNALAQSMADQALSASGPVQEDEARAPHLGGIYSPAFTDWELQEQSIAGGPFWIGADGADGMPQDQWALDEVEMRRLIDADESVYAGPEV